MKQREISTFSYFHGSSVVRPVDGRRPIDGQGGKGFFNAHAHVSAGKGDCQGYRP